MRHPEGEIFNLITVSNTVHECYLSGSQILAEEFRDAILFYLYDESGSPIGMRYCYKSATNSGYGFWFEKNLQGDIVAVYNDNGDIACKYTYDAWGNFTVSFYGMTGVNQFSVYNPFHYRGYYYDSDTGFYYLNSRYYDPNTGRFLNADGYVNANGDILGFNMFAYCGNNPVNRVDPTGEWIHIVAGGILGFATSFVSTVITGGSVSEALISGAFGAAAGALTAAFPGAAILINTTVSVAESVTLDLIKYGGDEDGLTTGEVITMTSDAVVAGLFGSLSGADEVSDLLKPSTYKALGSAKKAVTSAYRPLVEKNAKKVLKGMNKKIVKNTFRDVLGGWAQDIIEHGTTKYLEGYWLRLRAQ